MATSILVLEDDLNMQEMLVELLEDAGYFSQGAGSADEALQIAKKFEFELIISDVRMAGSTDGLGALAALKARRPELRCIVITGFASEDAPARAIQIQVDDYLYKPFRQADLLAVVKRVLSSKAERSGYGSLLANMFAAPKKLLAYAEAARLEGAQKGLEHERDRAFQAYFVGIRSNLISRGAALDVWDKFDPLEMTYARLTQAEGQPKTAFSELAAKYRQLVELMTAMAQSQSIGAHQNRAPGQVDRPTFSAFYTKVQGGQITQEQLRVAWQVFKMNPANREKSAEFANLHRLMWER